MTHRLHRVLTPQRLFPRAGRWALLALALGLLPAWVLPALAGDSPVNNGDDLGRRRSHRLIVELEGAPLALDPATQPRLRQQRGAALDWRQPDLARKSAERQAEQTRAMARLAAKVPGLRQSECLSSDGSRRPLNYRLAFNGFTVETDRDAPLETLRQELAATPGVKAVYFDYAHSPDMFASLPLIHATSAWAQISGGISNAGAGIKIASMDGGVHHAAPMFSGDGFAYPDGYPPGGLGETNNNNGKIIASRAYFRDWDPPVEGEQYAWPGPEGTSHGVHTSGTMAGNPVQAHYLDGPAFDISGVAPAAWIMSYKVFCWTEAGDVTFYSAEGIAALEDILADGAQVLNNSWGGGPVGRDEFDPLGIAVRNGTAAGIFTSFSAGNSGPERGTLDHSGPEYISVASLSTTSGGFSAGQLWVNADGAPTNILFSGADFGPAWPSAPTTTAYAAAVLLDPGNVLGCVSWPADAFAGRCALIKRGTCDFSAKVYEAQLAGAVAAIVYNDEARGDALMTMGAGGSGNLVIIPSVFIGNSDGQALVDWLSAHPGADVTVFFGNSASIPGTPNVVSSDSSRGPGVGNVLKPDIAAPGVNILSQGYGPSAGETKHLEYGAASGTSMASPHVAGAGALLRQLHPEWSNADIKSALMNTARFLDVFLDNAHTQLAQPLDMGAGCLDLARASDPGLLLDPPSLSFGQWTAGDNPSIAVRVRHVGDSSETFALSSLCTTGGPDNIIAWDALTFAPATLSLAPGESSVVTATLHAATAPLGDLQGFLVFSGAVHQAHMPAWGAVAAAPATDVLLLDFDASSETDGPADYVSYYTDTLAELGWSYDVLDIYQEAVPEAVSLNAYRAVLLFTGDNGVDFVSALYESDATRLTEFANNGGLVVVMGQSAYAAIPDSFFREGILGLFHVADSVTGGEQPGYHVVPADGAPLPGDFALDLGASGDGAHNQTHMNDIAMAGWREYVAYYPWVSWLAYPSSTPGATSRVAFVHRDQPVLNRPGISAPARVFVASFGLEGVNNQNPSTATRSNLLRRIWTWGFDEPAASLSVEKIAGRQCRFTAALSHTDGAVAQTRWLFGDSTNDVTFPLPTLDYTYANYGTYTAQVEVVNDLGNHAVASLAFTLRESYEEWADAQEIPAAQRGLDADPFSNQVPNLVAYATGISPQAPDRRAVSIALAAGSPFVAFPWRTDIDSGAWYRVESTTNLMNPGAWPAESNLAWQFVPLGPSRVEWQGQPDPQPGPPQKSYRVRFGMDD